jgi:hypothetical protein
MEVNTILSLVFLIGALLIGLTTFLVIHYRKKQGGGAPYLECKLIKITSSLIPVSITNIVFNLDTGVDLPVFKIYAQPGSTNSGTINIDTQGQVANSINGMSYTVDQDCILEIYAKPKTGKTKKATVSLYKNKNSTSKSDVKYSKD